MLSFAVPGVDVEVVGGPGVFKVMNGCSKNHGKNLQLAEPMLCGDAQTRRVVIVFMSARGPVLAAILLECCERYHESGV